MSSDRTRISYDPQQQYHGVIAQQGRVTLEADWNEAQQIINEEIRQQALDFVGACGTPDNGYEVQNSGNSSDFTVSAGTMYVGGMRAFLPEKIQYSQQQDWLDHQGDPNWVNIKDIQVDLPEFIYLYLREQEISAVEDSALREVALGGPDTTQRLRLIQHIVRRKVEAESCNTALEQAQQHWESQGLQFDSQTMRLVSSATLQVSFTDTSANTDPCTPEGRTGYLGADNQLIRVQIAGFDVSKKQYKLIWGFDNASFLYQVDKVKDQTLKLRSQPVDELHQPCAGQVVEVLRSAAQLNNGQYIASATGFVTKLNQNFAYNPDNKEIILTANLPDEYLDSTHTPQLFVRIWEEEISFNYPPNSNADVVLKLGNTGLQITLKTPNNQPFHIGDYWQIAVRPTVSNSVYPQRYLDAPQPPDGPRLWVCPLALIKWIKNTNNASTFTFELVSDCRNHFDNLVELTRRKAVSSCCTINVKPEDINRENTLQSIIDKSYQYARSVTICLMPGEYQLTEPLRIDSGHPHLTLKGCHDGVILTAEGDLQTKNSKFVNGLIILTEANHVTLEKLQFDLSFTLLEDPILVKFFNLINTNTAIAIRPINCSNLKIQNCIFNFPSLEEFNIDVFGSGIFASGECKNLKVQDNQFIQQKSTLFTRELTQREIITKSGSQTAQSSTNSITQDATASSLPTQTIFGYLQLPLNALTTIKEERSEPEIMPSLLQDAVFRDNFFSGLSCAIFVISNLGTIKLVDNTVRECEAGFWLESLSFWTLFQQSSTETPKLSAKISTTFAETKTLPEFLSSVMNDAVLYGIKIALFYPLLPEYHYFLESWNNNVANVQHILRLAYKPDLSRSFIVLCSNNIIDTLPFNRNSFPNIGLLLFSNYLLRENSELILNSNRISNQNIEVPTVFIWGMKICIITSNIIMNEVNEVEPNYFSLVFYVEQIAVAGNILKGTSTVT